MSFYTDVIRKSDVFHSHERCARLELLEPTTRAAVLATLHDAEREGHLMAVWETYRSCDRQEQLYKAGRTKLKRVGVHHYGLAADIIFWHHSEPSWKGDFDVLGRLASKYGLIWGGDWGNPGAQHGFLDLDHVQRISTADQPGLFAGTWYPDASYNPRG